MSMLRRVLDREALVKSSLIESLIECVKELQLRDAGERGQALTNDETTNTLCWTLEAIFIHGLKNPFLKSVSSALASHGIGNEPQLPEPSFWEFVLIFCHQDVIVQINKFTHIRTDIGRCRAWLRLALNDGILISYLQLLFSNKSTVKEYYKPNAFLRDTEKCDILKSYLYGIESYEFQLACNSSLLNTWNIQPLSMVGLVVQTDYTISQGIDVAENMDSKDLQTLPQLTKGTPPKPTFFTSFESRIPLLEEDEALRVILSSRGSTTSSTQRSSNSSRRNSDGSFTHVPMTSTTTSIPAAPTTSLSVSTARTPSSTIRAGNQNMRMDTVPDSGSGARLPVGNSASALNSKIETNRRATDAASANTIKDKTPDPISCSTPMTTSSKSAQVINEIECKKSSAQIIGEKASSSSTNASTTTIPISIQQSSVSNSLITSTEEDSYAALFQSYNRDSVIGTPITAGSFLDSQFSSGYGGGNLFGNETSTSSELDPALGSSLEDNKNATTPVDNLGFEILNEFEFSTNGLFSDMLSQIHMYAQRIPFEVGIDVQNYRCRSCERQIGMLYGPARLCGLTGFYYCSECHVNDESVIPSRILLNWDFTRYSVCKNAKIFLDEVMEQPIFDIKEINEKLYREVEECAELSAIRTKLQSISIYLRTCKEPIMNQFKREIWPKDYFYEEIHNYSLSDLLNIPNRSLRGSLIKLINLGRNHVLSCAVCQLKGFICEVCRNSQVIFPFDLELIYKCSSCGAVYHNTCMNKSKHCPRCDRWKISAYDVDLTSL